MSNDMRLIPAGAVLRRAYLTIPNVYGIAEQTFDNTEGGWNAAVKAAQAKKAALVRSLTESLGPFGTAEDIETTANTQVRIDLRWTMDWDSNPAKGVHTVGVDQTVETFKDVDRLRTNASFKARARA